MADGDCNWCKKGQCWNHGQIPKPPKGDDKGGGKGGGGGGFGGGFGGGGGGPRDNCTWCQKGECWNHGQNLPTFMLKGKGGGKDGDDKGRTVGYRTRLCNTFKENGECWKGEACTFAHGEDQLVKPPPREPPPRDGPCKWCDKGECWIHQNVPRPEGEEDSDRPRRCYWCSKGQCFEHQGVSKKATASATRGGLEWNSGWGGDMDQDQILTLVSSTGGHEKKDMPWSFVKVADEIDTLGIQALLQDIPDDWIDWKNGGKRPHDELHTTLILNMEGEDHYARLKRVASQTAIELSVRELFLSRVERIWKAEVYCLGVGLSSPSLRSLKDEWLKEEHSEASRKKHVPYLTEGHISLAYIKAECKSGAEAFVAEHEEKIKMSARRMKVDHVVYRNEKKKEIKVPTSTDYSQRPAKKAKVEKAPEVRKNIPVPHMPALAGAVQVDGSILEGGGQILRMTAALAALLGKTVEIRNIREGRSKPGLMAQHVQSLRLVRDICSGKLGSDHVGSSTVTFVPGQLKSVVLKADPGTAASITLMMQAALFPMIFASTQWMGCSATLTGGTDVGYSPPLDFFGKVLLPALWNMGVKCSIDLRYRGFYPKGGGAVHFQTQALDGGKLQPVDFSDRGGVVRADACLYSTVELDMGDQESAYEVVRKAVKELAPEVSVQYYTCEASRGDKFKLWVDLFVETTTGRRFHSSSEPEDLPESADPGGPEVPAIFTNAANNTVASIKAQLDTGAAVSEHLLDQLILPCALADGTSSLLAHKPSLHTRTALAMAELLVPGVRMREEKQEGDLCLIQIRGIGHTVKLAAAETKGGEDKKEGTALVEKLSEDFDFD
eukprot:TRINITY_DN12568_c1_g1_i1.p1 TRINITY_DN12568_c1_g1~~TRINITY_DN12568_c1_g1_i1.p1  ORF type:complete len:835 (-),score=172.22 TRINITY_DN12568_c1_g1_i1:117-2621(-)